MAFAKIITELPELKRQKRFPAPLDFP